MIAIFTSAAVALLIAGLGTPVLIRWFLARGIGQHIREDGPAGHLVKAGTPTMGGIAIVGAIDAGYLLGHVAEGAPFSRQGFLVVIATSAAALVGFSDDWIKINRKRNLGLNKRSKFGGLLVIAVGYSLAGIYWGGINTNLSFTRYSVPGLSMPHWLFVIWAVAIIVGSANAVNLTDGLDGLSSGSSAFAFSCLALISYWEFRHNTIYRIPNGLDLALVAVAMAASCVGFLWWNAAPARIIMGDTGSLALGTGLATLGLSLNLQLLIPIIGGLFVLETLSVVAQVISFRVFKRRIFRIAPIHHHFEIGGWPETTVTVRFWVMSALCCALGLGLFYADFLTVGSFRK